MKGLLLLASLAFSGANKPVLLPEPERIPSYAEEPIVLDDLGRGHESMDKPKSSSYVAPTRANLHRTMTVSSPASSSDEKSLIGTAIGANSDILQHLSSGSALSSTVCSERLEALRSLVDAGMYLDALLVSAALTSEDRAQLEGSCELEEVSFEVHR